MKFWKYIELDDGIGHGFTETDLPFWEIEIQGWNDNETFTDLTTLVEIKATAASPDDEVKFSLTYFPSELEQDLMISKLVQEALFHLREAIQSYHAEPSASISQLDERT